MTEKAVLIYSYGLDARLNNLVMDYEYKDLTFNVE